MTTLSAATWLLASLLAAEPTPPPGSPALPPLAVAVPPTEEADPEAAAWASQYDQARARMLVGQFAEAAATFNALASRARDPARQLLAREQATICERWARGGFVLMRASDLATVQARSEASLPDRRSADELGILYTGAVLYGLGTGVALDVWTEPGSAATGILPVLALGGAAVGVVYLLDTPQDLHYGVAQSISSGMWIGFEEGLVWTLWNQARAVSADEWSGRTVATALWGTATAGAVLGGALGTVYGTTPGRASFVGSTALWAGLVAGLLGSTVSHDNSSTDNDTFMLASSLGLTAGAVAGILVGKPVSPSIARVRFVDLGAIAGGVLVGGLYLAISNGKISSQRLTGALAGGITVGLVTAWQLTSRMEPDFPRSGQAAVPGPLSSFTPVIAPRIHEGSGVDGMVLGVGGAF